VIARVFIALLLLIVACRREADVYPPEVVANFMKNCTLRSPQKVCRCALDAVQRRFTLEQFRAFEARTAAGEMPKEMMDAVMAECRP
jgi:hypothetical protein